jgi:hypothetical protein
MAIMGCLFVKTETSATFDDNKRSRMRAFIS